MMGASAANWTIWKDPISGTVGQRQAIDFDVRDAVSPPPAGLGMLPEVRPSGAQFQPHLVSGGNQLGVVYYESRGPLTVAGVAPAYVGGLHRQLDARFAVLNSATGALMGTTQISRYPISVNANLADGETWVDIADVALGVHSKAINDKEQFPQFGRRHGTVLWRLHRRNTNRQPHRRSRDQEMAVGVQGRRCAIPRRARRVRRQPQRCPPAGRRRESAGRCGPAGGVHKLPTVDQSRRYSQRRLRQPRVAQPRPDAHARELQRPAQRADDVQDAGRHPAVVPRVDRQQPGRAPLLPARPDAGGQRPGFLCTGQQSDIAHRDRDTAPGPTCCRIRAPRGRCVASPIATGSVEGRSTK